MQEQGEHGNCQDRKHRGHEQHFRRDEGIPAELFRKRHRRGRRGHCRNQKERGLERRTQWQKEENRKHQKRRNHEPHRGEEIAVFIAENLAGRHLRKAHAEHNHRDGGRHVAEHFDAAVQGRGKVRNADSETEERNRHGERDGGRIENRFLEGDIFAFSADCKYAQRPGQNIEHRNKDGGIDDRLGQPEKDEERNPHIAAVAEGAGVGIDPLLRARTLAPPKDEKHDKIDENLYHEGKEHRPEHVEEDFAGIGRPLKARNREKGRAHVHENDGHRAHAPLTEELCLAADKPGHCEREEHRDVDEHVQKTDIHTSETAFVLPARSAATKSA